MKRLELSGLHSDAFALIKKTTKCDAKKIVRALCHPPHSPWASFPSWGSFT